MQQHHNHLPKLWDLSDNLHKCLLQNKAKIYSKTVEFLEVGKRAVSAKNLRRMCKTN